MEVSPVGTFPCSLLVSTQGPTVSGLAEVEARTPEEIMDLLHQGNLSRTQQATRANAVSSRSHAVLQVGNRVDVKLSTCSVISNEASQRIVGCCLYPKRSTDAVQVV